MTAVCKLKLGFLAFIFSVVFASTVDASPMSDYQLANTHAFANYQCENLEAAVRHAERAAEIAKQINSWVEANSQSVLALLYDLEDRHENALASAKNAVSLYKASKGERHRDYVESLASLAHYHLDLGHFRDAERVLDDALTIVGDDTSPEYHLARADIHMSLARIYLHTGRQQEAPAHYRDALALTENWPRLPIGARAGAYYRLAWAEAIANGNFSLAEKYLRWVIKVFETYRIRQKTACNKSWSVYGTPVLVWSIDEDPDRAMFGLVTRNLADAIISLAAMEHKQDKVQRARDTLRELKTLPSTTDEDETTEASDRDLLEQAWKKMGFL